MGGKLLLAVLMLSALASPAAFALKDCTALLLPSIEAGNEPPPKGYERMTPGEVNLAAYNRASEAKSRAQVKANLQAYIDALPEVDVTTIKDMDNLRQGESYRLSRPPTVQLVRSLPEFQKEIGMEAALSKISGQWILTIGGLLNTGFSLRPSVGMPRFLEVLRLEGMLETHLHSHPGVKGEIAMPSLQDLAAPASTRSQKAYIATAAGLVEMNYTGELPGGFKLPFIMESARWWGETNNFRGDQIEFTKAFTDVAGNTRVIPWSKREEIKSLLGF